MILDPKLYLTRLIEKIRTSALHQEGNNVARHEDLGQPIWTDEGEGIRAQQPNDPTQYHVYGCREERGSKKK
jgi:hypothetical protein